MLGLTPPPRIKLSKLRDIGWTLWDPIGLLLTSEGHSAGTWDEEDNLPFADEYDTYLIAAASALRRGEPSGEVVDYLVHIETHSMGLTPTPTTRERALAVVEAILADKTIWTWPDEHGKFR
ncbi:MAG: hypothetical protein CML02_17035 [Pseudooceanicola sp.]|nr:hypothetical protein [Pseudooceanicola sp.]